MHKLFNSKVHNVPNYARLIDSLAHSHKNLAKKPSLTLSQKILHSHLQSPLVSLPQKGITYLKLNPDRVAMQDASAQTAILQFMLSRKQHSAVPASIHCDHLIEAQTGAEADLDASLITNKEIFDFLGSASRK